MERYAEYAAPVHDGPDVFTLFPDEPHFRERGFAFIVPVAKPLETAAGPDCRPEELLTRSWEATLDDGAGVKVGFAPVNLVYVRHWPGLIRDLLGAESNDIAYTANHNGSRVYRQLPGSTEPDGSNLPLRELLLRPAGRR
jgi:hypothetical protein